MDRTSWGKKEEVQVGWVSRLKMGEVRWGEGFRLAYRVCSLFQVWRLRVDLAVLKGWIRPGKVLWFER